MAPRARTLPPLDCLGYTWVKVNTFTRATMMADVRQINELIANIYEYTTGQYYIGDNTIAFEKEEDAVAFKLGYNDAIL